MFSAPSHLPILKKSVLADLVKSYGTSNGMKIIAYGKNGGKIVGYGKGGKPIYADSSEAKALLAHKAEAHASKEEHTSAFYDKHVLKWLDVLGITIKQAASGVLSVDDETASHLTDAFGVSGKPLGNNGVGFHTKELFAFIGKPFVPSPNSHIECVAALASGTFGKDSAFSPTKLQKLKLGGDAGGSHGAKKVLDEKGEYVAVWKALAKDPKIAYAEEAYSRLAHLIAPNPALFPQSMVAEVKGEKGVLITKVPGEPLGSESSGHGTSVDKIQKHFLSLVQHQVMDWLLSNHDAHGANFHVDGDDVYAIDKGQAWKFIGNDALSTTYKGPGNGSNPIYVQMWANHKSGSVKVKDADIVKAVGEVLAKAALLSPEQISQIIAPYLAVAGSGKKSDILARFQTASSDWEGFLSGVLKKPGLKIPLAVVDEAPTPLMSITEAVAASAVTPTTFTIGGGPSASNFDTMPDPVKTVEQIIAEIDAPTTAVKMPGWPLKKGNCTVHHPGAAAPSTWPSKYPGPGYTAVVDYKPQGGTPASYKFVFSESKGKPSVAIYGESGTLIKSGMTIQEAADIPSIIAKGLDLNMTATEKKAHKPQVGYSATKLFQLDAFKAELAGAASTSTPSVGAMDVKELEEAHVVSPAALTMTPAEILTSILPTDAVTVIYDVSALPVTVQDFIKVHTTDEVGPDWKGPAPGAVAALKTADGTISIYGAKPHPFLGTPMVVKWGLLPGQDMEPGGHTDQNPPKEFTEHAALLSFAAAKKKPEPTTAEKVGSPPPATILPETLPETLNDPDLDALALAPIGATATDLKGHVYTKISDNLAGVWKDEKGFEFDSESMIGTTLVGAGIGATLTPPENNFETMPKGTKVEVPSIAPTEHKGPLASGTKITKQQKGIGEVVLHVNEDGSFDVGFPGLGGEGTTKFASLSAACDHVWVVSQPGDFKDAADYKKKKGTNKIPSGGGWKFWGLKTAPPPVEAPPAAAPVPEAPSADGIPDYMQPAIDDALAKLKAAPVGSTATNATTGVKFTKTNAGNWVSGLGLVLAAEELVEVEKDEDTGEWSAVMGNLTYKITPPSEQAPTVPEAPAPTAWSGALAIMANALSSSPVGTMAYNPASGKSFWKNEDGLWDAADDGDLPLLTSTEMAAGADWQIKPPPYIAAQVSANAPVAAPKIVETIDDIAAPEAKIVAKALWNITKDKLFAVSVDGHHAGEKPSNWASWVPPPGVILEGESEGKKLWLSNLSGGFTTSGTEGKLIQFVVWGEDGVTHMSVPQASADEALIEAIQKSGLGTNQSLVQMKEAFKLKGALFPAFSTMDSVHAPSLQTVLSQPVAEMTTEATQQIVTKKMTIEEAIALPETKAKYGAKIYLSNAVKYPGKQYLNCKPSSTSAGDGVEILTKFIADHDLGSFVTKPPQTSGWSGSYAVVDTAAGESEVVVETTVAEAAKTAPDIETTLAPEWAVATPGSVIASTPDVLASAPPGTKLNWNGLYTVVKIGNGWHSVTSTGVLTTNPLSLSTLTGESLTVIEVPVSGINAAAIAAKPNGPSIGAYTAGVNASPTNVGTTQQLDDLPLYSTIKPLNGGVPDSWEFQKQSAGWFNTKTKKLISSSDLTLAENYATNDKENFLVTKYGKQPDNFVTLSNASNALSVLENITPGTSITLFGPGLEGDVWKKTSSNQWSPAGESVSYSEETLAEGWTSGGLSTLHILGGPAPKSTPAPAKAPKKHTVGTAIELNALPVGTVIQLQTKGVGDGPQYTKKGPVTWSDSSAIGDAKPTSFLALAGDGKYAHDPDENFLVLSVGSAASAPPKPVWSEEDKATIKAKHLGIANKKAVLEKMPVGATLMTMVGNSPSNTMTKKANGMWGWSGGEDMAVGLVAAYFHDTSLPIAFSDGAAPSADNFETMPTATNVVDHSAKMMEDYPVGTILIDKPGSPTPWVKKISPGQWEAHLTEGASSSTALWSNSQSQGDWQLHELGTGASTATGTPVPWTGPKKLMKGWAKAKHTDLLVSMPTGAKVTFTDGSSATKDAEGKWVYAYSDGTPGAYTKYTSSVVTMLKAYGPATVSLPGGAQPTPPPKPKPKPKPIPKTPEQLAAEAAKAAEIAAKVAKAKEYADWAKAHPSATQLTTAVANALPFFQNSTKLSTKKLYAHASGNKLLIGSPEFDKLKESVDNWEGFPPYTEVDSPLGKMISVEPSAFAALFPSGKIVGPDGTEYPEGTTFETAEVPLPIPKAKTKGDALEKLPGFYKSKGASTSDPTSMMTKWKTGFPSESEEAKKAVLEQLSTLGITPTTIFGHKGGEGTMVSIAMADLSAPTEKLEQKFKTVVTPTIPEQPPAFKAEAPPFSLGTAVDQGQPATENRDDLTNVDQLKFTSSWGHCVRMGDPGILRDSTIQMKKVVVGGEEFTEIIGDLMDFDSGKTSLSPGHKLHFHTRDLTKPHAFNPETGRHEMDGDGYILHDVQKWGSGGSYGAKLDNGAHMVVGVEVAHAYRNTFVLRVPKGQDVEASLREAMSKAIGDEKATKVMARHDTDLERIFKKAQMVRGALGVSGVWDEPNPLSLYGDEAWLDSVLAKKKMTKYVDTAKIVTAPGNMHTVISYDNEAEVDKCAFVTHCVTGAQKNSAGAWIETEGTHVLLAHLAMGGGQGGRRRGVLNGTSRVGSTSGSGDEATGGATTLFTMPVLKGAAVVNGWGGYQAPLTVVFHPRVLLQTNHYSHTKDGFGQNTKVNAEQYGSGNKSNANGFGHSGRTLWSSSTKEGETLFTGGGVSINDVMGVACKTQEAHSYLVEQWKKNYPNQTHLNGRPVEEFFFVGRETDSILKKSLLATENP